MSEHRYHVSYAFESHPKGIAKKDVRLGWGATDAFLFVSIVRSDSGGISVALFSGDGKTRDPLKAGEVASVTGALLSDLATDPALDPELRCVFADAFERLQGFVASRRKEHSH